MSNFSVRIGILILFFSINLKAQLSREQIEDSISKYVRTEEYDQIIYFAKAQLEFWGDRDTVNKDYARAILAVSRSFAQLEAYKEAFKYNQRALEIFRLTNDSLGLSRTYSNMSGIYYYSNDSANAIKYHQAHLLNLPQDASPRDQYYSELVSVLLALEFYSKVEALAVLEKSLPQLFYFPSSAILQWNKSLELQDSLDFIQRYPRILNLALNQASLDTLDKFDLYLGLCAKFIELSRWDLYQGYVRQLDELYVLSKSQLSFQQDADYLGAKAQEAKQNLDFKAAVLFQEARAKAVFSADSMKDADEVRKLSAMIEVRTQELRNEELRQELSSSRFQVLILVIVVFGSLVIAILTFRTVKDHRERNLAIAEVANTRGKMISILSHDIRTPLGQLKALMEQYELQGLSQEYFALLMSQIKDTNDSTIKLLDKTVSWINLNREDFKLKSEDFSVGDIFKDLEDLVNSRLESKQIQLIQDINLEYLSTDRFLIQTALFNLLSNAIKFSETHSKIYLRSYRDDDSQVIEVKDEGKGIDAVQLQDLREAVSSSSMGNENEIGAGIGLVIVRDAIIRINGHLEIESEKGKGTSCRIIL